MTPELKQKTPELKRKTPELKPKPKKPELKPKTLDLKAPELKTKRRLWFGCGGAEVPDAGPDPRGKAKGARAQAHKALSLIHI